MAAGLLLGCGAGLAAAPTYATADFSLSRVAGANRFLTAAQAAETAFPDGAEAVVLANGTAGHLADALVGDYVAGQIGGPILLTRRDSVPASTRDALQTLGVSQVWVVGGTGVVSDAQVTALESLGYVVRRLGGATRYDTAAEAVARFRAGAVGSFQGEPTAILANGQPEHLADALAAGPVAFRSHFPVVLTAGDGLSAQALSALTALGITQVVVLGGSEAISAEVADQLSGSGITVVERAGGQDRSQTAALLAQWVWDHLPGYDHSRLALTSGIPTHLVDALAGGPLGGAEGMVIVETATTGDPGSADDFAHAHAPTLTGGQVLGGWVAVPAATVSTVTAGARDYTPPSPPRTVRYSHLTVTSVDAGERLVTVTTAAGMTRTFDYSGAKDSFVDAGGHSLTRAVFAADLGVGDELTVVANFDGTTTFTLVTDVPPAPSGVSAAYRPAASDGAGPVHDQVTVSWAAPSVSGSTTTVTSYNIYRAQLTGGTAGSFTKVGDTGSGPVDGHAGTAPAHPTDTSYTDQPPAGGQYVYRVTALAGPGAESPVSGASEPVDLPGTPYLVDARAEASLAPQGDSTTDAGDTIQLVYSEPVDAGAAADGTTFDLMGLDLFRQPAPGALTCGGNAACELLPAGTYNGTAYPAGQVERIYLLGDEIRAPVSYPTVSYPIFFYPLTVVGVAGVRDLDDHPLDVSRGDTTIKLGDPITPDPDLTAPHLVSATFAYPAGGDETVGTLTATWDAPAHCPSADRHGNVLVTHAADAGPNGRYFWKTCRELPDRPDTLKFGFLRWPETGQPPFSSGPLYGQFSAGRAYDPESGQPFSGKSNVPLAITTDVPRPPTNLDFYRTSRDGVAHLSWTASTSPDVVSYNVYRGKTYADYNAVLTKLGGTAGTSYSDPIDVDYLYYAVTAVTSDGTESPIALLYL